MIFRNKGSLIRKTNDISQDELVGTYGLNSYEFTQTNKNEIFVCSKFKELDLIELDQLLQTVGWSRRPMRRGWDIRSNYMGCGYKSCLSGSWFR